MYVTSIHVGVFVWTILSGDWHGNLLHRGLIYVLYMWYIIVSIIYYIL